MRVRARGLINQPYFAVGHFYLQWFQALAFAGAADAEAGQRLVNGVVVLAEKMFAVGREETAVGEIEAKGEMAALVFVGDQLPVEPREKSLGGFAVARDGKFKRFAFGDFVGARDFGFGHAGSVRLFTRKANRSTEFKFSGDKLTVSHG
jgi:hypothetical protein